jgi:hypothetical protein
MLKSHTELQSVNFKSPFTIKRKNEEGEDEVDDPHHAFRLEIDFYTSKKH